MNITIIVSLLIVIATIYSLIKGYETRLVLIVAGLILCTLTLHPMASLDAFAHRMVSSSLIQAICSSMGFAFVIKYTKCDIHLITLVARAVSALGILLIPIATALTFLVNIALPSAAGCAAAVGATFIPILIRSKIHPAMAAAAILCGTIGSFVSPGLSHNAMISKMANMEVIELIRYSAPYTIVCGVIGAVSLLVIAFILKDHQYEADATVVVQENEIKPNFIYALAPFIPLVILLLGNTGTVTWLKMGVPQAMVIGVIFAMGVTWCNPSEASKEFFKGMGTGYGDILGIIIAASVFAAGLKESGLIASFISVLTHHNELARWGATVGPYIMGIITGSGDAAALTFNETVTPHAATLGFDIKSLGSAAAIAGGLGRTMSPLAGAAIVCAGLANVSPLEVVRRTAVGMTLATLFIAVIML